MNFQPKTCTLKTGSSIRIRVPEVEEAEKLVDLKRSYIEGASTLPMILDEYPKDVKNEEKVITEYGQSTNSFLLVAEYENEFIGNIDLTGSKRSKMCHTGMIGMGIGDKWRNQGLGRLLIEAVLNWAKDNYELKIIWLDVYASNELGYNLYKNMGFEESGRIPDFFKEGDAYIDKIQMYLRIR